MPKESRVRRRSSATTASSGTDVTDLSRQSRSGSRESATQTTSNVWTTADDDVLASARAAGMNWQPIATRFFPNKSANACRKRHERLMERRHQGDWDQDRLEELSVAYFECRKEIWSILGQRLGEKWSLVEGKCMEKGLKNLQTIARASHRKRNRLSDGTETRSVGDHGEDDSGIGLSDVEIDLSRTFRPASAPAPSTDNDSRLSRSLSPVESRRRPAQLPLYQPPVSCVGPKPPTSVPSWTPVSVTAPITNGYTKSYPAGRDILSIQSILSPAD